MKSSRYRSTIISARAIHVLRNRRLARTLREDSERLVTAADLRSLRLG